MTALLSNPGVNWTTSSHARDSGKRDACSWAQATPAAAGPPARGSTPALRERSHLVSECMLDMALSSESA
jgi:hypothetical protein